jgi:hypothetical protein
VQSRRVLILILTLFSNTGYAAAFTVSNTNDSGAGSLRQAVLDANATPAADIIQFSIPGNGPHRIILQTGLIVQQPLIVDGFSQPGSVPNTLAQGGLNAQLMIEISGAVTNITAFSAQLPVDSTDSLTLRGLVINRLATAVRRSTGNLVVEGCYVGTDVSGQSVPLALDEAITLGLTRQDRIGGLLPAQRNLISGASRGISSYGVSVGRLTLGTSVSIQGNLVGTNAQGSQALPNSTGILLGVSEVPFGSLSALIGGNSEAARNVISGNLRSAIAFNCASSGACGNGTQIWGNFIGTSASGMLALGNGSENSAAAIGFYQVGGESSRIFVGGAGAGEGNRIAFNSNDGVRVSTFNGIVRIAGNQIYANNLLGINNGSGATGGDDPEDADAGPNRKQNFPVFAGGEHLGTQISARYRVNSSTVHSSYPLTVHFYGSINGSGALYLGEQTYTTPSAEQTAVLSIPTGVAVGFVVSTATDAMGNTSQFSAVLDVDRLFANGFD